MWAWATRISPNVKCGAARVEDTVCSDAVVCACGTGATLAGIAAALAPGKTALGISVLRGIRS